MSLRGNPEAVVPKTLNEIGFGVFASVARFGLAFNTLFGNRDAEADVIRTAVGFEAEPEGGTAEFGFIGPGAAAADTGGTAVAVGGAGLAVEWIGAAREARVVPIAAPFECVAVHVVQAPGVG